MKNIIVCGVLAISLLAEFGCSVVIPISTGDKTIDNDIFSRIDGVGKILDDAYALQERFGDNGDHLNVDSDFDDVDSVLSIILPIVQLIPWSFVVEELIRIIKELVKERKAAASKKSEQKVTLESEDLACLQDTLKDIQSKIRRIRTLDKTVMDKIQRNMRKGDNSFLLNMKKKLGKAQEDAKDILDKKCPLPKSLKVANLLELQEMCSLILEKYKELDVEADEAVKNNRKKRTPIFMVDKTQA